MPVIKLKISTAKLPNMTKTPNTETQVLNIISYLKDIIWHLGRWESVIGGFLKLKDLSNSFQDVCVDCAICFWHVIVPYIWKSTMSIVNLLKLSQRGDVSDSLL